MSLVRLLTAGKSLVGVKDSASRYRMANPASMPKFHAGKNPFRAGASRAKATTAAPGAAGRADGDKRPGRSSVDGVPRTGAAAGAESAPAAAARILSGTVQEPGQGPGGVGRTTWTRLRRAMAWCGDQVVLWSRSLRGLWQRGPGRALSRLRAWRPIRRAPRPNSGVVQPELSLDHVRVKRNDLSDADLELAPAMAIGTGKSVSAVTAERQPPAGEERKAEPEPTGEPEQDPRQPGQTPSLV